MCGIFGHFPTSGKGANIMKIKVLGLDNIERGRDSCGYYYGGNIHKGVEKFKEFDKLIQDHIITMGDQYPLFLGHTRSASPGIAGGYSAFNAHPFECGDLVLTHNGVIYNINQLAEEFDVDIKDLNVDSHKLAKIISETGLDVLNRYVGAAALAFTLKTEPSVGYIYHGKSNEKSFAAAATNGKMCFEERPLYIMQTPEGLFYSSKKEGLLMIRESEEEEPIQLDHNIVYKVVNGIFSEEPEYTTAVVRIDNNLKTDEFKNKPVTSTYSGGGQGNIFTKGVTQTMGGIKKPAHIYANNKLTVAYKSDVAPSTGLVWKESMPLRARVKTNICFYWKGRYWIKKAESTEPVLANGSFVLDKKGFITVVDAFESSTYIFYNGIMMKSAEVYMKMLKDIEKEGALKAFAVENKKTSNVAYFLSKYSKYAIPNLEEEATTVRDDDRFRWFEKDTFEPIKALRLQPKFSSRTYVIKDGYLVSISSSDKQDTMLFDVPMDLSDPDEDAVSDKSNELDEHLTRMQTASRQKASTGEYPSAPELFADRKAEVRVAFNSIFDHEDWIYKKSSDVLDILKMIIRDIFLLDYGYNLDNKQELDNYTSEFISEAVRSEITLIDNMPPGYDLDKYLTNFYDDAMKGVFEEDLTELYETKDLKKKKWRKQSNKTQQQKIDWKRFLKKN
jgi:hypothetical protein